MAVSTYEALKLERTGHIAIITLNRPEKLNALDPTLTSDLHRALDDLATENDIRTIVITGAGRGFCSGADVNQQLESLEGGGEARESQGPGIVELGPHLRLVPQPIIAAVNGVAAGAGLAIALASDIRIASESARFSCIFVKRSLVPDTGSSYTLSRLVGQGIAMEMALTGNIYDAEWALEKGLVNRVVPAERLMEEALAVASDIASNPPLAVRSIKQLLYEHDPNLYEVLPKESAANAPSAKSEDRLEAVRSFLEKRPPVYKGR
ncbi:MAG: enoyl-CoA hydratase/isomerase family protein [Chloroflexi bacterium]|nr:enoyl-CoA hydratase/isomerase family protein [Chloroflexota bacterium]